MNQESDLKRHLNRNEVCAFIGAGLSIGAGLPNWYDLISELAQRIGKEMPPPKWSTSDTLIDTAQTYVNTLGLQSLISFLKERLDTVGKNPTAAHQALARLPISLVFTANYDDLLERAYRDIGKRVEVIVRDSHIPFMQRSSDVVNIVKLYGDLNQPDTLVLARQQYESFFLQRPQLVKLLETEIARSDIIYLGWSHTDPHFNLVFGELLNRYAQFLRMGHAVMFDVSAEWEQELRRKHLHIVQLPSNPDRTEQLALWLDGLTPKTSKGDLNTPKEKNNENTYGKGNQWSILIGVDTYEDKHNYGHLPVCVKDVEAIQTQLLNAGFESSRIRLLTDTALERPTRANILTALKSIAAATEPDDLLLFYYSGHGDMFGNEPYLVAQDGHHLTLDDTGVSISRIKEVMDNAPARAKVIILDACHSGANIGGKGPKPMSREFIERVFEQAEGIAILSSCKQAQLSYVWSDQERSVFTKYMIEALEGNADYDNKGFVTVQDISRYVVNEVKLWASQHNVSQSPTLQYSVTGDIILVRIKQL